MKKSTGKMRKTHNRHRFFSLALGLCLVCNEKYGIAQRKKKKGTKKTHNHKGGSRMFEYRNHFAGMVGEMYNLIMLLDPFDEEDKIWFKYCEKELQSLERISSLSLIKEMREILEEKKKQL